MNCGYFMNCYVDAFRFSLVTVLLSIICAVGIPVVYTRHILQYAVHLEEVLQGSVATVDSDMQQSAA